MGIGPICMEKYHRYNIYFDEWKLKAANHLFVKSSGRQFRLKYNSHDEFKIVLNKTLRIIMSLVERVRYTFEGMMRLKEAFRNSTYL